MIDHILGKPSPLWRRTQVFLVILFWVFRLYIGDGRRIRSNSRLARKLASGMEESRWRRLFTLRRGLLGIMGFINQKFERFTPYQLIVGTMTAIYALRNLDVILGLGGPEPLTRLYSRAYYRASYISTAFDAGFATAMTIRPKWFRDICSVWLSAYYLIYAQEADEKLRRYRAICTVEMLRVTWEKTNNPYLRALTYFARPSLPVVRKVLLPRPKSSKHSKPISAMLFFARPEAELHTCTELILDFPGGGFIAMGPDCHEERLRRWAKRTGKPVLSVDYGKAPEYPYPWAIDEGFDVYRILTETKGGIIGMNGQKLDVILSGDSAGGNVITTIMLRILETADSIPHPVALVLAYPALDFNFKSFMSPEHLRILRTEQSTHHIPGVEEGKDHMRHKSPLSVVSDVRASPPTNRKPSWTRSLSGRLRGMASPSLEQSGLASEDRTEEEKSLRERVKTPLVEKSFEAMQQELNEMARSHEERKVPPLGTRLTMTSRTGYFQDRIISPSMMRAMAILYIGPKENPDFETDYYISPILAPEKLLAQFPRVFLISGEKDPFVDDTVILAGKIRQAKRVRREEVRRRVMAKVGKVKPALRMSQPSSGLDKADEALLNEDEDDWVQMRIIEGWGHGFMQMVTIMAEAEPVLLDVADWIDEAFAQNATTMTDIPSVSLGPSHSASRNFSLVKPARYKSSAPNKTLGSADMGVPISDGAASVTVVDTDDETDDVLSFSTKKVKLASSASNSSHGDVSRLSLPRVSSAPRFDLSSELLEPSHADLAASVQEAFHIQGQMPYRAPKTTTFAFFGTQKRTETPTLAVPRHDKHRSSSPTGTDRTRAIGLSEAELLRRRRMEAVYGMGEMDNNSHKVDDEPEDTGFRW